MNILFKALFASSRRASLKWRLSLITCLLLVVMGGGIIFVSYYQQVDSVLDSAELNMVHMNESIEYELINFLKPVEYVQNHLIYFYELFLHPGVVPHAFESELASLFLHDDSLLSIEAVFEGVGGVTITSEEGKFSFSKIKKAKSVQALVQSQWYQGVYKKQQLIWHDGYGDVAFKNKIAVALPYFDSEKLVGVVHCVFSLTGFNDFLHRQTLSSTYMTMVVDEHDFVVSYAGDGLKIRGFRAYLVQVLDFLIDQKHRQKFTCDYQGRDYVGAYLNLEHTWYFGKGMKIVTLVSKMDVLGAVYRTFWVSFFLSICIVFFGVVTSFFIAKSISNPIESLQQETDRIQHFDLDGELSFDTSIRELHLMKSSIHDMKAGLRSFKKYVPARLVKQLLDTGIEAKLGGEQQDLTVLFSDIEGFTSISETMTPVDLINQLSSYLTLMAGEIRAQEGTIDKYIGDAVMAFFNAPVSQEDHVYQACVSALMCQEKLVQFNQTAVQLKCSPFHTRIGIHTGTCVVGNMGSNHRLNYTAVGDGVNIAARLESVNTIYGTDILASQAVFDQVQDRCVFRLVDEVILKGKSVSVKLYQLMGLVEKESAEDLKRLSDLSEAAFVVYQKGDFKKAKSLYQGILKDFSSDPVASFFVQRCEEYLDEAPGKEWDGVTRLFVKG